MSKSLDLLARLASRETAACGQKRVADLMEKIRADLAARNYAAQAARIGEMEAQLVDEKIAARIVGLLDSGALLESRPRSVDLIGIVEDHVGAVLRPSPFAAVLGQTAAELEKEIGERELTAQAKATLQRDQGMSEEEAHLHLRAMSRKSRRPVVEIARELVEARNSWWVHRL